MKELERKLRKHELRPFPSGMRGKRIDGIDLTVLDCDGIAHILSFVETEGQVSTRTRKSAETCLEQLEMIVPVLSGDGASYFKELQGILSEAYGGS